MHKRQQFVVNAEFDGEPVQFFEERGDMLGPLCAGHDPGCHVLDMLETVQLTVREAKEKGVAVVQARVD